MSNPINHLDGHCSQCRRPLFYSILPASESFTVTCGQQPGIPKVGPTLASRSTTVAASTTYQEEVHVTTNHPPAQTPPLTTSHSPLSYSSLPTVTAPNGDEPKPTPFLKTTSPSTPRISTERNVHGSTSELPLEAAVTTAEGESYTPGSAMLGGLPHGKTPGRWETGNGNHTL